MTNQRPVYSPGLLDHRLFLGDVSNKLGVSLAHNVAQLSENLLLEITTNQKPVVRPVLRPRLSLGDTGGLMLN